MGALEQQQRCRRLLLIGCIALLACAPRGVSGAAAEAGSTPEGRVGDSLKAWIEASRGVELEGVYLGDAPSGRNLGVFAAKGGLEAGEAYIAVPWGLVLGAHSIAAHRPALAALMTQLKVEYGADDKSVLLLLLMHEHFVSPRDSPWRDYLNALPDPDGFDTPLHWDTSLLRELAGSAVLDEAIAEQTRVRAVFKGFSKRVFSLHKDLFPPAKATLEALTWAWSIVHSRASTVPGKGLVLVPLADMVNDGGEEQGQAQAGGAAAAAAPGAAGAGAGAEGSGTKTERREFVVYDMHYDRAVVYAKRSYVPGEEVTESYGAWSMADTVVSAGYLPSPGAPGGGGGGGG
eukprot:CAMPEP_0197574288 /NCGR_PEP_ID=MMETSP1326-20131121/31_1 /TAXON_ID=1155430 /ORGANISM="Genus nov. species nov., Strain RCC2288" /LENGTH=345 /DNA_ID=CAMNT_0043136821 /DNA_START=560 /DNA_END=1593 /DNA_ORIENTATION=+